MNSDKQQYLEIGTILSNRTKEGMVEFKLGGKVESQWDISKAKEIHRMLGEAIEAAVSDTLIYKFLVTKVGFDEEKAARVLLDFRELRQGTRGITFPF